MKKKGEIVFLDDKYLDWKCLNLPIDNDSTYIYIPTPKNWKCKKKGCKINIKHKHGSYYSLAKSKVIDKINEQS